MKAFGKILSLLLVLMMCAGVAGADEAVEKETIIIGTNAEFPPFEFIDDDGQFSGFDMELIAAILTGIGVDYEYVTMDFDALLPALASGKIDVSIAAMTIREDRTRSALFSDPYFHATQKIIVQTGNENILSEADLEGKKIGVQLGTTGDLYVSDLVDYEATIERYTKALDAVMDLSTGRLEAVVVDEAVSAYFVDAIDGLTILADTLSDEQYGIAMKLGEDDFMAKINAQLATMQEDGSYDAIFEKYFGSVETEAGA